MNRQIRRVEEKKERKQEEKKRKAREERKEKRRGRAQRRQANARKHREAKARGDEAPQPSDGGKAQGAKAGRRGGPGRFSGALMIATVFFISLQAVTPTDGTLINQIVSASFYLLFGYFAVLWMMRRDASRPILLALAGGLTLAVATSVARLLQPELMLETLTLALIPPLLAAGAWLGRVVHLNAPG